MCQTRPQLNTRATDPAPVAALTEAEMHPWHGAAKTAVTQHFLDREPEVAAKGVTPGTIDATFAKLVTEAYSKEGGGSAANAHHTP